MEKMIRGEGGRINVAVSQYSQEFSINIYKVRLTVGEDMLYQV